MLVLVCVVLRLVSVVMVCVVVLVVLCDHVFVLFRVGCSMLVLFWVRGCRCVGWVWLLCVVCCLCVVSCGLLCCDVL